MTHTAARAAVLGLVGALGLGLGLGPAAATTPATTTSPAARPAITKVVLVVDGCDDCRFAAHSYVEGSQDVWSSRSVKVRDGRVVLRVPVARTEGLTVSLSAPWERRLPAVSQLVFRYAGQQPGDRVTAAEARAARRGSPCFPGIDAARIRLKVQVHRAHFRGNGGRATGAAAYTVVSQPTFGNQARVYDGFYGAQDVVPCS